MYPIAQARSRQRNVLNGTDIGRWNAHADPMATSRKRQAARREDLEQMLEHRQAELNSQVLSRIERLRKAARPEVHGQGDDSDADVQRDIDVAMIQLQAEASRQIDAARKRIAAGEYGDCASCGKEIPTKRLQALPFAVYCLECAGEREHDAARARRAARDRVPPPGPDDARS
jgi:DnaK suppressor protein